MNGGTPVILAIDVGNTITMIGVYDSSGLLHNWTMMTDTGKTSDEYGVFLSYLFEHVNIDMSTVDGAIISSVVPPAMNQLELAIRRYFGLEPLVIGPGIKTGINIKYENPREVGADKIVNAVAGLELYGGPLIIVDFGTATTFCALSARGEYLGGVICPGIRISADALFQKAAKLPWVDVAKPDNVIGRNIVESMQSGLYYGFIGQVDFIVRHMKAEMSRQQANRDARERIRVVATGSMAGLIAPGCETIDEVNGLLTLEGLRIIYERNKKADKK